jgi:hypothetical protein
MLKEWRVMVSGRPFFTCRSRKLARQVRSMQRARVKGRAAKQAVQLQSRQVGEWVDEK